MAAQSFERPEMSPAQFARAVADLRERAFELACAVPEGVVSGLPEATLPEVTESLHATIDQLSAVATAMLARVHASGVLREQGVVSTKTWLTRCGTHTQQGAGVALARARDASDPRLRATTDAWSAGTVTAAQAGAICRGLSAADRAAGHNADASCARSMLFGDGQDLLVRAAQAGATVKELEAALSRLRAIVDPDGGSGSARDAYDEQTLKITQVGDQFAVRGALDLENGAALLTVLDKIVDGWYRDQVLTRDADSDGGSDPTRVDAADRTRRCRRDHDRALALGHLARTTLDAGGVGTSHGVRPHVTVFADFDDLVRGLNGRLAVPGAGQVDLPAAVIERLCCDAGITIALARRLLSDDPSGDVLAGVLRDTDRELLYLGREARTATPKQWAYLVARDQHCRWPGCTADPTRCQPHHTVEWQDRGFTDVDLMTLLCHGHHHLVHEDGWTITPKPGAPPGQADRWNFHPPPRR